MLMHYFLLLVAMSGITASPVQPDLRADAKTIAYLKQYRADYVNSLLNAQTERLPDYWTDGIRLMTESQRTMIGAKPVLTYYNAFLNRFTVKSYTRTELEILDLGKQVAEYGQFSLTIAQKTSGKQYNLKGNYQTIWEKQDNTKLAVITEGWNYDHWLDLADLLRFPQIPVVDVALQAHLPVNSPIRFELAALNRLMEKTIAEHDAKLWMQFYSDESILFAQHHSFYKGRKEIDAYIEMHTKELPIFEKLDVRNDRIDDLGPFVIEYASHIANWRNGESSGIGLGKDLRIWRREANGSLKIFRHMGMYD
ncbi:nuclear transport factor 2 family protein [Spirosoma sp. SC4-14]|uniref:YybH family protein n=1 Tax=Spirosoma sp. SC4-14 TaxID=3128900 RepID=UPI0030CB4CE9